MNFVPFNAHTTPLLKNCNVLNFADVINVESCIFINNCFNRDSFSNFNENFKLVWTTHSYNTRSARNGLLFVPSYNTVRFGRKSIIHSTTLTWNYLQDKLTEYNFLRLTPKSLKILLVKFFISEYNSWVRVQWTSCHDNILWIWNSLYNIYIHRRHMVELSICDVFNMPIAILINFLFIFSFFFLLFLSSFSFFSLLNCFCVV